MKRLGKVLHVSKRGSVIVRSNQTPPIGKHSVVLDKKANRVGSVIDVFGPTSNPYVAVRPAKGFDTASLVGQIVYLQKRKK